MLAEFAWKNASAFFDGFTFVELSNGMVIALGMAKSARWVRPDVTPQ